MLVAMFKSNSNAFDGANMNRLRTGAIITIPNAVDASASSPSEATKVVQVQASDWRAYRDRVAGAAPSADETTSRASAGRIGTSVQERTPAARPSGDQLRVSKDAGTGKGSGVAETSAAQAAQLRGCAEPHRRSREDAEGHAARDGAARPDDGAAANAV